MKRFLTCMLLLFLVITISGCWSAEDTTQDTPQDVPLYTEDEACSLVYWYISDNLLPSREYKENLTNSQILYSATYLGNNKWSVSGFGYDYSQHYFYYTSGVWYVYESTGVVVPGNEYAREVVTYLFE